ncbi:hypothetical protein G1H11_03975 [Phytoactinopolyspora alkaliphila]|uniref:DUF2127 domain-containing protein n=1 Tax=Phytoactinopolyspora alkaliphila TaxID=1783498 RepID=A0A6N9YHI2_9ACTN|nr:hypothetical protein [Phytoactinopolyspora alkaliphila]NED94466.1 hypothetical protein [Phytoactinopolyspora alkaliphila]
MSGTTPGGSSGDEPQKDPFSQPTEPARQPPSWEQSQPPAWEQDNTAGSPYARPVPETPKPILTAAKLMYVGAFLSLLGGIFALMGRDAVREEAIRQSPDATADEIDAFVNTFTGFMVFVALISIGLWLWMASANKKGKSWARIVATILGGLNILFGLWGLTAGGFDINTLINLISPVLAAVILYMLYRPESTEYYRAMSSKTF